MREQVMGLQEHVLSLGLGLVKVSRGLLGLGLGLELELGTTCFRNPAE